MNKPSKKTIKKLTDSPAFKNIVKLSKQLSKMVPKNLPDFPELNEFKEGVLVTSASPINEIGKQQLKELKKIETHFDNADKKQKKERKLSIYSIWLNIIFFIINILILLVL